MSLRTEDIQAYLLAVELGGIGAAARDMDLSKSVVSKRITDLERELGVSLLQRSTCGVLPTEAGRQYYEQARAAMTQLLQAAQNVSANARELSGELRILAPMSFGMRWLSPLLAEFGRVNPRLHLMIELDDRMGDAESGRHDVAIRITRLGDIGLVARRLGTSRRVLCCSPDYAARAGLPQTLDDVATRACLGYSAASPGQVWAFRDEASGGTAKTLAPRPVFSANNGDVLRDAAVAGHGFAVLPHFIVADDLRAGRLIEVRPGAVPVDDGIFAVYPRSAFGSVKLRALVQFLQQALSPAPWEGQASSDVQAGSQALRVVTAAAS